MNFITSKKLRVLPALMALLLLTFKPNSIVAQELPIPLNIPFNYYDDRYLFYKFDGRVYLSSCLAKDPTMDCLTLVPHANPATFKVLEYGNLYAKDSKNVYVGDKILPLADPDSFELMDSYAKDKKHVYFSWHLLRGVDPKKFKESERYGISPRNIFFEGRILRGANAKKFKILNAGYSTDLRKVYFDDLPLKEANPYTFTIITNSIRGGGGWAHDSMHVYYEGKLTILAPKSVVVFTNFLAKDDTSVICNQLRINNADAKTFQALNDYYAKDKNRVYVINSAFIEQGKACNSFIVVDADTNSFHLLPDQKYFAADKKHVFYLGKPIPNVSPDGFDPSSWQKPE